MRAGEIMTRTVITVHPGTSAQQAAQLMTDNGVASLPVLDDDGRVVGIVSESDLIRGRMPHDPRTHPRPDSSDEPDPAHRVGDVMTDFVVCLGENADVADLAAVMLDNNVQAVPIVDGATLIGIVSRRDLVRTLLRDDAVIRSELTQRVDDYAQESGRWKVEVDDGVVTISGHFDDEAQQEAVTELARTVPGVARVHLHRHWV